MKPRLSRFRERERDLGRDDLILPVYYISAREIDVQALRESNALAAELASRQFADWRELRFEAFTSPVVRKAIAQLATRMRDTFWQPPRTKPPASGRQTIQASAQAAESTNIEGRVTAKTEPPTHVVDAYQRGDFATVSEAIRVAKPGDRILIRPGLYQESLVIDKPLEILGDGPAADIEIRAHDASVLTFMASIGRVANLTLRQAGDGGDWVWFAIEITQGRLDLEGCDISSQSGSCVAIRDGADPRVRRNRIHDGKSAGVLVYDNGLGTLEDNDITGHDYSAVEIRTGGNPTLRRNQIHDGKTGGVLIHDSGRGTLEDNDINERDYPGVTIRTGGNPALRHNQIHGGKAVGVYVCDNGLGTLEDNDITGHDHSGVTIRTGANPTLRANRINHNAEYAVQIFDGGRGVIEDNDLSDNSLGALSISTDCESLVVRARNKE